MISFAFRIIYFVNEIFFYCSKKNFLLTIFFCFFRLNSRVVFLRLLAVFNQTLRINFIAFFFFLIGIDVIQHISKESYCWRNCKFDVCGRPTFSRYYQFYHALLVCSVSSKLAEKDKNRLLSSSSGLNSIGLIRRFVNPEIFFLIADIASNLLSMATVWFSSYCWSLRTFCCNPSNLIYLSTIEKLSGTYLLIYQSKQLNRFFYVRIVLEKFFETFGDLNPLHSGKTNEIAG